MTNITELAQRMKAAAEKATPGPWYVHDKPCEDGNYGIDTSDKEFLAEAVVWWGFARQSIWREEDAKYIALANPANILALVEALASEKRICSTWRKTAEANGEKLEKAQQRIAELESRTVKLPPKIERNDIDGWFMYKGGRVGGGAAEWYNKALDDVGAELTAAGIKWEAE
ncbi:ead/Ea22-like family protein [Klebsiella pneumoniae]|uniref:ead/Ea22-like family protein n=1 Tax=Klebsiella pneumoniae TaxID=573 RepID=UPI001033D669|nr:ead/Ea22-like family protein [Klebsiella pneumoniae]MBS2816645.1 ead/Ea22-like family protein [Klebsiella pneumoniae]MCP5872843.1 ead/Ea22-like family protein [Klebsiella pneumoniae]MCQ0864020.1 ead/Ea22-like family protein [Klebsiella pneumoniae]HBR1914522.1 ead/Ea22-like family protein [Klebsiella pneumoniae]HBS5986801.1 ead/Ea22-like family protein [Klebsiella pneumoniae]